MRITTRVAFVTTGIAITAVLAVIVIVFISGTKAANSQQAWRAVLEKCATSNLLGSDVVYFGASNAVGPGSIWRRAKDRSYRLFYELSDLERDDDKRKGLVKQNPDVGCQGDATSNWSVTVGLPFESSAIPLKADVSADLKQARDVNVTIAGYAMDELKEGPFEEVIQNHPRLTETPGAFVIAENAIRVTGFEATFVFDEGIANQIRPKYENNFISLKEGATLKSDWISKTNLKLTATEPFYVLAGFGTFTLRKDGNGILLAKTGTVPASDVAGLASDRVAKPAETLQQQLASVTATVPAAASIRVVDQNGVATLVGTVGTAEEKSQIGKIAQSAPNAPPINNRVAVRGLNAPDQMGGPRGRRPYPLAGPNR